MMRNENNKRQLDKKQTPLTIDTRGSASASESGTVLTHISPFFVSIGLVAADLVGCVCVCVFF